MVGEPWASLMPSGELVGLCDICLILSYIIMRHLSSIPRHLSGLAGRSLGLFRARRPRHELADSV
jgi:hypothetical protein